MPLDPAVIETIKKRFPAALVYLNNAEVAAKLEQAVAEEWSPETFEANLKATAWYMKTTDAQRVWYAIESGNPGEATNRVNARKQQIRTYLYQLGAPEVTDEQVGAFAWQSLRDGWSESDLRYNVATVANPAATSAATVDVRKIASEYMIQPTDAQMGEYTRRTYAGQMDEAGLRSLFAKQAAGQFPALADIIAQGHTPADYFDPYKKMISKYTNTPEDQVDLNNNTWTRIVSHATPDGKMRPMTIDEAKRYVRSTEEFANSSTGQAELASYQMDFAKMLGMRR